MRRRVLTCFGLGVSALSLGLCLVWINLELVDLSYSIKEVHDILDKERDLNSKLEVEHMNLLSSYQLRKQAARMELAPPRPGQVRTLE